MAVHLAKEILRVALEIHENEFSKKYVIPMLQGMGYVKVEFHGGPNEGGKDIIAWKKDEAEFVELTLVQVKKYPASSAAKSDNSFSEIITQLQQAAEKRVPSIDKQTYRPSKIYFVTPYQINTRALESRFEAYESLKSVYIKVLDGPKLSDLFKRYIPDLLHDFIEDQSMIRDAIRSGLTNNELKSAMNVQSQDVRDEIYSDLDFSIGNISTKFFFDLQFPPKKIKLDVNYTEFHDLIGLSKKCSKILSADLITDDVSKLNNVLTKVAADNLKVNDRIEKLQEKVSELNFESVINDIINLASTEIYDEIKQSSYKMLSAKSSYANKQKKSHDDYANYLKLISEEINSIWENRKYADRDELVNLVSYYLGIEKEISRLEAEIAKLRSKIKPPVVNVTINGDKIATKIKERQNLINNRLFNSSGTNKCKADLIKLIEDCESVLKLTDELLSISIIADSVGVSPVQKIRDDKYARRTGLNIIEVLETGRDFVLYGEPGAGKTTTLQHFTRIKLDNCIDKTTVYVPLSKTIDATSWSDIEETSQLNHLLQAITKYLTKQGAVLDAAALDSCLAEREASIIFDGLDEVYDKAPWVIGAITKARSKYPYLQIVVSSRTAGPYSDKLEALGLTLLPFTDEQRRRFFVSQLGDTVLVDKLIAELQLNNHLNEIVRNPLNATMLCFIFKNNMPIPETEIKLYSERMRLMLGYYDIHKNVKRISSDYYDLWLVLKKVAYHLHSNEKRHTSKEILMSRIVEKLKEKLSSDKVCLAIDELIFPCCVLQTMTIEGEIGFGHLRFQEFMAATELNENRSIDIMHYLRNEFWKGAVLLFAKMTDSIEFLVSEIIENGSVGRYYDILKTIIEMRSIDEVEKWMPLVEMNMGLDKNDYFINRW